MKVAALQMVSGTHRDDNLRVARELLEQAARSGAELAVLPEYFCLMGHKDTDKLACREPEGEGVIQSFLADTARALQIWIVGGTLPMQTTAPDRVRNTTLVFDPRGHCAARYDKIHLFCFDNGQEHYDEGRVIEAGQQPVHFDLLARDGRLWRVGLSVCYDLRFPELYRQLARAGARVLLVPAAFTAVTGEAHWEPLLRARAIENQCYVVAANQGGTHETGRQTWGHSMVIDPWGRVLACRASGQGTVLAPLDGALIDELKRTMPVLQHARLL